MPMEVAPPYALDTQKEIRYKKRVVIQMPYDNEQVHPPCCILHA